MKHTCTTKNCEDPHCLYRGKPTKAIFKQTQSCVVIDKSPRGQLISLLGAMNCDTAKSWVDDAINEALINQQQTHHQELQKAREEERERILSNILKWSKTATVTETTGREGAKRATTKLRNSLAGCYHFLYQALRINHSELDQNNK